MAEKPLSENEGTEGQRLFDTFLRDNDLTLLVAARALEVSEVTILHWRTGNRRPVDHQRTKIRIWAGIPESAWRTPEEIEEIARVQPFASAGAAA